MSHPLEQKFVALRRHVRRMAAVYGLSVVAAMLLGTLAVLGLIDYLLRFQDLGLRIIASLLVLGVLGWTFYRYLFLTLSVPIDDVVLALRVQRQFPGLKDRLISAVDFLHAIEDDPTAGSASLRGAVVSEATAEAERLDFSAILDPRPMVRATALLIAVCLAVGVLVVLNPSASRVAVARLANPFDNTGWPRTNNLVIRRPVDRVARGQAFQIEVVDARGARMPRDVMVHYRFTGHDGDTVVETDRMVDADGTMIARRENVLRPFSYRVEGGDDRSMPWHDVQVVEPPRIESTVFRLVPPAYTGWPPVTAKRPIRALVGTEVQIVGKTSTPLRSAILCLGGGRRIPAQLSDDGRTFTAEFTVEKTGHCWFELTDRDGLVGGDDDRWEVHAVRDASPTVSIEQPTANLFVTPSAVVPLRIVASDDIALRQIAIVYRRMDTNLPSSNGKGAGDEGGEEVLQKYFETTASRRPHPNPLPEREGASEGERRVIDDRWDLAPLGLKPGMQLTFFATAEDHRPQTGKSNPRNLTVITVEQLQDRITGREKIILAELNRALKIEQGCRAQVESLVARLAELPQVGQAQVDRLQAVGHHQRDVDQILIGRGQSVPMHVAALLADLENNRILSDDVLRRMLVLLAEIDRMGREHLPAIGRELTTALKAAQVELEEPGRAGQSNQPLAGLATAAKHQDAVIASLAELIGQVARWDDYRRFARQMGQLLRQQGDIARRTAEVGRRTLTQELRDLQRQDVVDLNRLADRQLEMARRLDRLLQEMDQAGAEYFQEKQDPSAAKAVEEALELARRLAISGKMRAVGRQIDQNQIGRAATGQKQVDGDLQRVLTILIPSEFSQLQPPEQDQSGAVESRSPEDATQPNPGDIADQMPGDRPAGAVQPRSADDDKTHKPNAVDMRTMMKRLWGELPEHARGRMLQLPTEKFPPKYERQIEAYYRRLADEGSE